MRTDALKRDFINIFEVILQICFLLTVYAFWFHLIKYSSFQSQYSNDIETVFDIWIIQSVQLQKEMHEIYATEPKIPICNVKVLT